MLNQGQIDQFYDQGYVIIEPLDSDLLKRLRKTSALEAAKALAADPNGINVGYTIDFQPGSFV